MVGGSTKVGSQERGMHISIRKYRCNPDQVPEAVHRVDEIFAPMLEDMPGFVAYEAADCGDGIVCSFTICHDREAADRSLELAAEFVRDDLADIDIERLEALDGEVKVSRARSEVLEPAHA
jgi:hypothetical protein